MSYDYEKRAGFIYFIQESILKNIKIGFTSSHPKKRLKTLATASSQELHFIGFMLGNKPDEKRLHNKFKHLHVRNEWFEPGDDLIRFIEKLDYGKDFEKALSLYIKSP
jgi:hypothetical protein